MNRIPENSLAPFITGTGVLGCTPANNEAPLNTGYTDIVKAMKERLQQN